MWTQFLCSMDLTKLKKYKAVGNFCNQGFALVYSKKDGYNFIDKEGNEILPLGCSRVRIFKSGIILLVDKRTAKSRLVDFFFNEFFGVDNFYEFQIDKGLSYPIKYNTSSFTHITENQFDLDTIPYDGSQLQLPDYHPEKFLHVFLCFNSDNNKYSLVANSGEVLLTGETIEVIAKKDKYFVVHCDNQLMYASLDAIKTIELPVFFKQTYNKHLIYNEMGPFVVYHNTSWCNGKLVPIYGWDDLKYSEQENTLTVFQYTEMPSVDYSVKAAHESLITGKAVKIKANPKSGFKLAISSCVTTKIPYDMLDRYKITGQEEAFAIPNGKYIDLRGFKIQAEIEYEQTAARKLALNKYETPLMIIGLIIFLILLLVILF